MNDHKTLEKLKAGRQFCLRRIRSNGTLIGCALMLVVVLHFTIHTDPLQTALLLACLCLTLAPFGVAYVILGWHIKRMTRG
jgi:hypothetical protein